MKEAPTICSTCLSADRHLVSIHKISVLLQEIHFVEMKKPTSGVCWECWSIIIKFHKFRRRAVIAQETLLKSIEHNNLKSLTTLTTKFNHKYNNQFIYICDPLTNNTTQPKLEPELIKQECIDQSDENIDNTSDLEEKLTDIPEKIESVYVEAEETYNSNIFLEQDKNGDENDEKTIAKTIENPQKYILGNSLKKNKSTKKVKSIKRTELNEKVFKEKFEEVMLTEEEIIKIREEKRNHHNFKKIPYKCDSCVLGFTKKETYDLHMTKKHDQSIGEHICEVCSVRFPYKLPLNNHKRKHYVNYRCKLCKYESHDYWFIFNHCQIKHGDDDVDNIHCTQCDVVVKTAEDLEDHVQKKHTVYCNECGVKFKGQSTLRRHKARIHAVKRDFICDICTKTFKTKTRLESHMVKHNSSIAKKLAYCQECKIQYKNIYVYRIHLKSSANHSEKAYSCPECNKKFASKVYWKQHYNFYHLKKSQFKCEICNKIFISDWRLKDHKQKHHGLTRPRDHSCNICGKKFYTLGTLRSHQLIHSDQRSFMCEDCGDTFKQSAALYTHTRLVHKGGGKRKSS